MEFTTESYSTVRVEQLKSQLRLKDITNTCNTYQEGKDSSKYKKRKLSKQNDLLDINEGVSVIEEVSKYTTVDLDIVTTTENLKGFGFQVPFKRHRELPLQCSNPASCLDITDDLYSFHFETENYFIPMLYFDQQTEITPRMRTILIDWLVEVHGKYHLQPPVLWSTVNIIDRYLNLKEVARDDFQLVGVSALFIANKFEVNPSLTAGDCSYLTNYSCTTKDIVKMEMKILQTLNYELMVPTAYHFLLRFLQGINASKMVQLMAFYVAEKNLQHMEALIYSPCLFAAGSLYVALHTLIRKAGTKELVWTTKLQEESRLNEQQVVHCAKQLQIRLRENPIPTSKRSLNEIKRKYSTAETHFVGEMEYPAI